jgi:hypothetical protein
VQLHAFLSLAQNEDEWPVSFPDCYKPGENSPQFSLVWSLGGSHNLKVVMKRKIPFSGEIKLPSSMI